VQAHRISFQQDEAAYHFAPENWLMRSLTRPYTRKTRWVFSSHHT
jgi:hypothetical protein